MEPEYDASAMEVGNTFTQLAYDTRVMRDTAQAQALGGFVRLAYATNGDRRQRVSNALDDFVTLAYDTNNTHHHRKSQALDQFVTLAYETALEFGADGAPVESMDEEEDDDHDLLSGDDGDENSSEEEEEEEEDEDQVEQIDNALMRDVKRFYDHDMVIFLCNTRRFDKIFSVPHTVQWWYKDQFPLRTHGRLNSERYLETLRETLWLAHEYLQLFGFCGFFIERDMEGWLQSQDWRSEEAGQLPFSVIELGQDSSEEHGYYRRRRRAGEVFTSLEFHCHRRAKRERFDCFVFERKRKARFESLSESEGAAHLVPLSPFFALYTDKLRVLEVKVAQYDANSLSARPEHIVYTTLLPEPDLEKLPRDFTYAMNDLDYATQIAATKRTNTAVSAAQTHLKRLGDDDDSSADDEQKMAWARFLDDEPLDEQAERRDSQNPFKQRIAEFRRPTLVNMLTKPLPPNAKIQRGPSPRVLIRYEDEQRLYEANVCNLMDCPPDLLRPYGSASSSSSRKRRKDRHDSEHGNQSTDAADNQLRLTFERLSNELYRRSFGRLDAPFLENAPEEMRDLIKQVTVRLCFQQQQHQQQQQQKMDTAQ